MTLAAGVDATANMGSIQTASSEASGLVANNAIIKESFNGA